MICLSLYPGSDKLGNGYGIQWIWGLQQHRTPPPEDSELHRQ